MNSALPDFTSLALLITFAIDIWTILSFVVASACSLFAFLYIRVSYTSNKPKYKFEADFFT